MKISIIGTPSNGKSTLAQKISEKLSIPHIHLDRFWFEHGGKTGEHDTPHIESVRAHVLRRALEAINAPAWVSDGFYSRVQPFIAEKADIIIFLDIPLWQRLFGHAKRVLRPSVHKRHKELSGWDDIKMFFYIMRYHVTKRRKLKKFVKKYAHKTVILRSWDETNRYVAHL